MNCKHTRVRVWEATGWEVNCDTRAVDLDEECWDDVPAFCLDCKADLFGKEKEDVIRIIERRRSTL